jgi:hypothetical protein
MKEILSNKISTLANTTTKEDKKVLGIMKIYLESEPYHNV